MATVPDTTNFTLQDVVNATGGTSLRQAFTNATAGLFDPAYVGSKDRMSNFRNYGGDFYQFVKFKVTRVTDHVTLLYSNTSAAIGLSVKFTVTDPNFPGYSTATVTSTGNSIVYTGAGNLTAGSLWKLERWDGSAWISVLTGTI